VRSYPWVPAIGALIVIVIVALVLRSFFISYFSLRDTPVYPTPTPTPSGVELQRANNFWPGTVFPLLGQVVKTLTPLKTQCFTGSRRAGCRSAIVATDQKLQLVMAAINKGDIPACIATHVATFRGDVESMDGGLQISLIGYKAGDQVMISRGLAQFVEAVRPLVADGELVNSDLKAYCH
jgi:hypothetical protein